MTSKTDKPIDFAASLAELEAIATWFESDNSDIDQSMNKFERGMELASELKSYIESASNRVEKIKQRFDLADSPTADESSAPALFDV